MEFNISVMKIVTVTIYTEEGKPRWMSIPVTSMFTEISILVRDVMGEYD